jgi:hypothetical protein
VSWPAARASVCLIRHCIGLLSVTRASLCTAHGPVEHHLRFRQFIAADGCIWLHYRGHDEMGSQTSVLD